MEIFENGSGKSCLLRALGGIEKPTSGRVDLLPPNQDLSALSLDF